MDKSYIKFLNKIYLKEISRNYKQDKKLEPFLVILLKIRCKEIFRVQK